MGSVPIAGPSYTEASSEAKSHLLTSSTYPFASSSIPFPGISPALVHTRLARSGWVTWTPVSMTATTTGVDDV
ncbi:MAG: hypothetical protein R2878_11345 [Thermoleophilia bacterium]